MPGALVSGWLTGPWRPRLSSLALAAALIFALAGLFAADELLSESERKRADLEAVESAALAEGFLEVHAQALQSLRGIFLYESSPVSSEATEERFDALVTPLAGGRLSFRRVWITDSAGTLLHERLFGSNSDRLSRPLDVDTVQVLGLRDIARTGRTTRVTQVSRPGPIFTGESGFVILEPVEIGGRFVGFIAGTITSASLIQSIERRSPHIGLGMLIVAGGDTVGGSAGGPPVGGEPYAAMAELRTPGGARWEVLVTRSLTRQQARVLIWVVGLTTLGALLVLLLHERRQGVRLSERSAELERLSTELLRANRSKSEFLANVSHELRTPLNAIVGFVDLLRDGVYGELAPRQVNPVERIASSANHLRHLVDQILDIAKIAAGRVEMHVELVDLRPFVLDVASEVETLISERGLNLSIAIGTSLPRVRTDPTHLRQILVNLLGNAVKYTPTGGVAVRARLVRDKGDLPVRGGARPAGWALGHAPAAAADGMPMSPVGGKLWIALQVADSGIGIAPVDHERVFEEFEQVNAGPRGDSMRRGTGLGLPISRRLARLLGGEITLESELGKGSTFTVWLPVDPADVRPPEGESSDARDKLVVSG